MYKRFLLVGSLWNDVNKRGYWLQTIFPLDGSMLQNPMVDLTVYIQATLAIQVFSNLSLFTTLSMNPAIKYWKLMMRLYMAAAKK